MPPHPTLRELAGEAYSELVGWDGKVARTTLLLVRRPGWLTLDSIDGKRARYISPVRLYLLSSVVYFLAAASVPLPDQNVGFDVGVGFGGTASADQTPAEAALDRAMIRGLRNLTPEERELADAAIAVQPRLLQPLVRALAEDAQGVNRRAIQAMPRVLFVLVPLLAAILALFYRGRHFPEHLYFALHFQAFVFVILTIGTTAQWLGSLPALAVGQAIAGVWIGTYGIVAQHRVYGGSWMASAVKGLGVGVVYLSLWSAAVFAVTLWVTR